MIRRGTGWYSTATTDLPYPLSPSTVNPQNSCKGNIAQSPLELLANIYINLKNIYSLLQDIMVKRKTTVVGHSYRNKDSFVRLHNYYNILYVLLLLCIITKVYKGY